MQNLVTVPCTKPWNPLFNQSTKKKLKKGIKNGGWGVGQKSKFLKERRIKKKKLSFDSLRENFNSKAFGTGWVGPWTK